MNGLNALIKRHRVTEWIIKYDLYRHTHIWTKKYTHTHMLSTRDLSQNTRCTLTESEGMEKIFHASRNNNKSWGTNLMLDKLDFKQRP